jgi:predicted HTH domain antitoxin
MRLELPDDILRTAELTSLEVRLALAVQLYADRRIDFHQARRISGVSGEALNRELTRRDLCVLVYPSEENDIRKAG